MGEEVICAERKKGRKGLEKRDEERERKLGGTWMRVRGRGEGGKGVRGGREPP